MVRAMEAVLRASVALRLGIVAMRQITVRARNARLSLAMGTAMPSKCMPV